MGTGLRIHVIAGARPNFMKVAPIWRALSHAEWANPILIHTGQHYDEAMSGVFLKQLGLPTPLYALEVGSGTHAEQTAKIMLSYERLLLQNRPDLIIVVGDVNSTLACALVAAKCHIPIGHLEAGLRSGDRAMPEEINRILTDAVADVLWTPSNDADANLRHEGIPPERIDFVGNIMIDCFELHREEIAKATSALSLGLHPRRYGVLTLHRPSNVDDPGQLCAIVEALRSFSKRLPLIAPLHPRTRRQLEQFGLFGAFAKHVSVSEPLGYIPFMSLISDAQFVITDSGGVQEETTYLNIPCLTLRSTTERPITVSQGTNELVQLANLPDAVERVLANQWKQARRPPFWDGRTAQRVAASIHRRYSKA
jgi:UDP-N-acetylglucosamine 2-epimerase (non-hydrolysing)